MNLIIYSASYVTTLNLTFKWPCSVINFL